MADAKVTIGGDLSEFERAMSSANATVHSFADSLTSSMGFAARSVASSLSEVALGAGKISFSAQHAQVREFEAATARLAVASGSDLEKVRTQAEATGLAIGKRPQEVAAWSSEVGKLTYSFEGAASGMKGMAELAASTGRNVNDYRGLAVELQTVGRVAGDTSDMVGILRAQADKLGVKGGVAAFADQVEGLNDVVSHFAISASGDFAKVTAMAGEFSKVAANPQAAMRIQQQAFGSLASNPMEWSRYLGHDIYDEKGEIADPTKTLQEITSKIERTYGKDARRELMLTFGAETGSAMHNVYKSGGFEEAKAAGLISPKQDDALQRFLGTDAGKRDISDSKLEASSRELMGSATALGKAADALQRFASEHPVASTFGTTAASSLIGSVGGNVMAGVINSAGQLTGALTGAASGVSGFSKAVGVAGGVLASFGAGYAAGTLLDETFGISDRISGTGKHSRIKSSEDQADVARDAALAERVRQIRAANAARHGEFSTGGAHVDHDVLAQKFAAAIKNGLTVDVHTAPDNPLTVVNQTSQSAAAGTQTGN